VCFQLRKFRAKKRCDHCQRQIGRQREEKRTGKQKAKKNFYVRGAKNLEDPDVFIAEIAQEQPKKGGTDSRRRNKPNTSTGQGDFRSVGRATPKRELFGSGGANLSPDTILGRQGGSKKGKTTSSGYAKRKDNPQENTGARNQAHMNPKNIVPPFEHTEGKTVTIYTGGEPAQERNRRKAC